MSHDILRHRMTFRPVPLFRSSTDLPPARSSKCLPNNGLIGDDNQRVLTQLTDFQLIMPKPESVNARCDSIVFWLRPYLEKDRVSVFRLLSILPALYPGGSEWLERRLSDALSQRARCTLAMSNWGQPIGITIETPKERHRLKLSTIYVHPSFRGFGVGKTLLSNCHSRWRSGGLHEVYVTADLRISGDLLAIIGRFGFALKAVIPARYGADRDEAVFDWRPERNVVLF